MSTSVFPSTRRLMRCAAAIVALAASASSFAQTTLSTAGVEVRAFLALASTNVYAATHGGGLWRSTDGTAASWSRIALTSANERYLTSVAGTASVVIVGAEEGLLRSTNGTTFSKILHEPVSAVAVSGTTVLAAIRGVGIMRSTDSGASFTQATNSGFTSLDMTAVAFDPSNGSVAYATSKPNLLGAGGGVFRSSDGGSNWAAYNDGIPASDFFLATVEVASNGTAYVGVFRPSDNGGDVYYRASAAGTWSASGNFFGGVVALHRDNNSGTTMWGGGRTLGLQTGSTNAFQYAFSQNGQPNLFYTAINAVTSLPGGSPVVLKAIRGAGIWRSTASGTPRTWTRSTGLSGADRVLSAANVGGSGTSLLAGLYAGGVWRSTDSGASWSPPTVNNSTADFSFCGSSLTSCPIPFVSIWELAASPTNANLAYAASGGVGMFYGNDGAGLFRWNGSAWQGIAGAAASAAGAPYNRVLESGFFEGQQIYGVALNRADENVAYASLLPTFAAGFQRRSGSSWINMNAPGATVTPQMRGIVTSASSNRLIAMPFDDKPVLSTDSGVSWNPVSISQTGFERVRFFAAAESPTAATVWIGGSNKGLFYSTDSGGSWTRTSMAGVFAQLPISAVGFNAAGKAFAADFDGNRYCSPNGGVTWVSAGSKLNAGVNAMRLVAGKLYYLTDGAGMVREDGTC